MAASHEGRTDVVELLIKHNADVNARTEVRLHIHYIDREIGRLLFMHAYKHVCVPLSLGYVIICHTQCFSVCSSRPGGSIVKVMWPLWHLCHRHSSEGTQPSRGV